jgi:hypothetical protein
VHEEASHHNVYADDKKEALEEEGESDEDNDSRTNSSSLPRTSLSRRFREGEEEKPAEILGGQALASVCFEKCSSWRQDSYSNVTKKRKHGPTLLISVAASAAPFVYFVCGPFGSFLSVAQVARNPY